MPDGATVIVYVDPIGIIEDTIYSEHPWFVHTDWCIPYDDSGFFWG